MRGPRKSSWLFGVLLIAAQVVYVVVLIYIPFFKFRCKVTKNIWYFPTFPHKKFFSYFFSIFSTKLSTTYYFDNQCNNNVIIYGGEKWGIKCLFCAEAERFLFVILVGCEKVSSCLFPGIWFLFKFRAGKVSMCANKLSYKHHLFIRFNCVIFSYFIEK